MNKIMSLVFSTIMMAPATFSKAQEAKPAAQGEWKIQPVPLQTRWAKQVTATSGHQQYPRPQLRRASWTNLNGLWDYAISEKGAPQPATWAGKILVPYPLESALSGVKKSLLPGQLLWYKRNFEISRSSTKRTLLNFGAVDYQCWVYLNGKQVGSHEGGYTAFTLDISEAIRDGQNELVVKVYDPSDAGYGPRGKQVLKPASIYYTPSSGIWQTVWLEQVPLDYIQQLVITPDIDKSQVNVVVRSAESKPVTLYADGKTFKGKSNQNIEVRISSPKLWSPASPHLYDLSVGLGEDKVSAYFGMRKIAVAKDKTGTDRIMLNNKPYFNLGTLDQGFWPDGLYTAPTDQALAFDIQAIKAMGFNTIRKHIKVEPARWYYLADKIGMLVWQDFVQPDFGLREGAKEIFEKQGAEMLAQLHNQPCITTYVLFNEKWGQFDQERLTRWIKQMEPSRLVNGHSGEFLYVNGKLRSPSPNAYIGADMTDVHSYPQPMMPIKMQGKAQVCGEFGGIGVFIPDHQWLTGTAWGYVNEKALDLKSKYTGMVSSLEKFSAQGLSGSIYTQPFDVEGEQNGLMTYDREVIKIPFAELRKIHAKLNPDAASASWTAGIQISGVEDADLSDPSLQAARACKAFEAGARDQRTLQAVVRGATDIKAEPFKLMLAHEADFRKAMGSAKYSQLMSGLIFEQAIQPLFEKHKTWEEIQEVMTEQFGAVGTESAMRIMLAGTYNGKEWDKFLPAAKTFLARFGQNLTEEERDWYQAQVKAHQ